MSSVAYKNLEIEESTGEHQGESQKLRPFAVPSGRERAGDQVARRVAEVLDFELMRGSMPA